MPWPIPPQFPQTMGRTRAADSLNVAALREITDEGGGRTEVVREGRDLDRATGSIADRLSKQYYLLLERRPSGWALAYHPRGCATRRYASERAGVLRDIVTAMSTQLGRRCPPSR